MSYQDETEKLKKRVETLEQEKTPSPSKYPLKYMRGYIEKLVATFGLSNDNSIGDLLTKLTEKQAQYEAIEREKKMLFGAKVPTTKSECEAQGGTWDDIKETCKLPKREATESFNLENVAILPTSQPSKTGSELRVDHFRKKLLGDK